MNKRERRREYRIILFIRIMRIINNMWIMMNVIVTLSISYLTNETITQEVMDEEKKKKKRTEKKRSMSYVVIINKFNK